MVETTKTAEALETATSGTGLMQSEYYKLKFNPETGKIESYGEMMLPYDVGAEAIDFTGRNFKVKVVNKKTNDIYASSIKSILSTFC